MRRQGEVRAGGGTGAEPPDPDRRRRRWPVVAVAALLAVTTSAAALWVSREEPPEQSQSAPGLETVPVTAGNLVAETIVRGTLAYPGDVPVAAGAAGVVTMLPPVGTVVQTGQALYAVDTRPVVLLAGVLPAWRDLAAGMTDGEDVRQLEQNLAALGHFADAPDARFTARTTAAVKRWQKSLGVEQTGAVPRATIRFSDHPVRVAALTSRVGAEVGPGAELYTTSGTDKRVDVDLALDDQQLAVAGAPVTVVLPDGTELAATVAGTGDAVERPAADGSNPKVVVPVTLALADQASAAAFSRADVSVRFASTLGEGVLTVPVEALVAIDASSFGVEVPGARPEEPTTVIPVTVGAFASGRAEISGEGVAAGLDVVVPSR